MAGDALETRLTDLGGFIREQRRTARLSLRKLSERAGISNPYLSQIERGLRKPSAEILQAIARGLSISAETLYIRAGILDARDPNGDLEAAILADPTVNDRQKQALIEIYRSFQAEHEAEAASGGVGPDGADDEDAGGAGIPDGARDDTTTPSAEHT